MRRIRGAGVVWALVAGAPAAGQAPFVLDTLQVSVDSRLTSGVGAVVTLTAAEMAALPVRTVEEALGWMLGVDLQSRSPAQADVSIRGSTFEQVLVLVDGVRMSDPQTGHFDLDLAIPLERVERVEILRGPASAIYGAAALGGVIHIITKDGRGRGGASGATRFQGGSEKTWGGALDVMVPAGGWRVGGGLSHDASDGHREGTDYRVTRATGRLVGFVGPGRTVVDVGHARRRFGAADFYAPFPSQEETRTTTASGRWVGLVGSALTLEPRLSWRKHEDDFVLRRDDPGFYRNLHDSRRLTGELQARLPVGPAGALALGGEWSRERLASSSLGDRDQEWRAAYGELVLRSERMQLQGGLRYDDRDDVGDFVSPSASVRWESEDGMALRASWGKTFRAPTWTERYYTDPANVGTPNLGAERGWSAEASLEMRNDIGTTSVTAFRRVTENLIDWARPAGSEASVPWETRNVETATVEGVEILAQRQTENGVRLEAGASWLTLEAQEAEGFVSKYALRPLHRVLTLRTIFPLQDNGSIGVLAADRARLGGERGITVDLRLEFPLGQALGFVDVRNVTGEEYLDVTGFPIPGRAFIAGVRTRF